MTDKYKLSYIRKDGEHITRELDRTELNILKPADDVKGDEVFKKLAEIADRYGYVLRSAALIIVGNVLVPDFCADLKDPESCRPLVRLSKNDPDAFTYEWQVYTAVAGTMDMREYGEFMRANTDAADFMRLCQEHP